MTVLNTANKIYSGTSVVSKVYAGTNLVWPPANPVAAWKAAVIAAGGTVSGTREALLVTLVNGLIADGIWDKLDRIWVYAAENIKSAYIDLKGLDTSVETVPVGTGFTADRGYAGNGSSAAYINTTFNPYTEGVQYTTAAAHMAVWDNTNRSAETSAQTGANDGVGLCDLLTCTAVFGPVGLAFRINGAGTAFSNGNNTSDGFFIVQCTPSNIEGFRNGASVGTGTTAGIIGRPNTPFFVDARSDNGAAVIPSSDQIAAVSYGGSFTSTQVTAYYNRMRTYMTAVGVP